MGTIFSVTLAILLIPPTITAATSIEMMIPNQNPWPASSGICPETASNA